MIVSHLISIKMKNISDKVVEKIKMHILYSVLFSENVPFVRWCGKILLRQTGHR